MHDGRTRKVDALEPRQVETFLSEYRATITITLGPAAGTEFLLDEKRAIVGRASEARFRIDDPSISSEHAAFELDGEGFGIRDLASTNGVRVNGAPILSSALKHGDRIALGECELQYIVEKKTPTTKTWTVEEDV